MAWIRACGGGLPAIPDGKTVIPINDVVILQKCAGISNPTYTTLAQILADSSLLATIMATDNAVDYLVRSTYFATDVCANQAAMQQIGANNYCADTLLDDGTWRSAIFDSTYMSNVFNSKVPQLSGSSLQLSAKDYLSTASATYYPWRAFDGSKGTTNAWVAATTPSWIQWLFNEPTKVVALYRFNLAGSDRAWLGTLQGSNDGSTFTDIISDIDGRQGIDATIKFDNPNKYKYYRLVVAKGTSPGSYGGYVGELQLYGRKDV